MKLQLSLLLAIVALVVVASVDGKHKHHDHLGHHSNEHQLKHHHSKVYRRDSQFDDDVAFECPDRYGYYPHNNCWQFWQCGNWIAYKMTCAPGTQWSQDLLTCDHTTTCQRPPIDAPSTAKPVDPTTPKEDTPTTSEGPITEPASTEQPSTAAPQDSTTTEAEENPTTTEAEQDPSTANPTTTEIVGDSSSANPTSTESADDGTTATASETPESTEQPSTPGEESFKCPERSGYYPHKDCWKFWQCGNYIAYEMTCSPATQWAQDLLTCDHITTCQRPLSFYK